MALKGSGKPAKKVHKEHLPNISSLDHKSNSNEFLHSHRQEHIHLITHIPLYILVDLQDEMPSDHATTTPSNADCAGSTYTDTDSVWSYDAKTEKASGSATTRKQSAAATDSKLTPEQVAKFKKTSMENVFRIIG
ncbi:uncharacterized protein B0I36DRAFT_312422 [Microdochium trichocladiopsis]|uniref:Uncharacterized protein n=1 Tax=Microdochium trichocladiopsis TaxID=1682393 RepID=A0A9P8YJN6_9PEZI|nr:uncharacterized protein B0I36DRAFT_312422 [Microdochium trichocladiopsis]KAH7041243.1 hypothetical protein B0I36DRAFT_312422 [Microdochium trichocladiopsis]